MCVNVYRQHDNTTTWQLYSTNFCSFHIFFLLGFVHCEHNRAIEVEETCAIAKMWLSVDFVCGNFSFCRLKQMLLLPP